MEDSESTGFSPILIKTSIYTRLQERSLQIKDKLGYKKPPSRGETIRILLDETEHIYKSDCQPATK